MTTKTLQHQPMSTKDMQKAACCSGSRRTKHTIFQKKSKSTSMLPKKNKSPSTSKQVDAVAAATSPADLIRRIIPDELCQGQHFVVSSTTTTTTTTTAPTTKPVVATTASPRKIGSSVSKESKSIIFAPHQYQAKNENDKPNSTRNSTNGYTLEAVNAIRTNDVTTLRRMLHDKEHKFDAGNANGESLLHLACRRSDLATILFLIQEAQVRVNVSDDMGRTVLHDLLWRSTAQVEIMAAVLPYLAPQVLRQPDVRGHTPFEFAPSQHGDTWTEFLVLNQETLQKGARAWLEQ